ncbi:MAG TPA: polysaccharide biosynthesis/export family protein [Burkholderiaceae bacterium]|nr:polysaccharide biosynthesis/export family protein [Burkholderiaceae bacterium]
MRARTGAGTGTARAIVRAARPAAAVAFAAVLAGCAWAPGFWLGRPPPERSAAQREADSVVPVAIDWGLIHELDATARAPVPQVPTGDAAAYRIGPGDALRVTVWNHPDLNLPPNLAVTPSTLTSGSAAVASNVVPYRVVDRDGAIYFPLAGRVPAVGRTVPELRSQIARQLSRYVKDPQVEVEIAAYRSQRVFMVGELKTPGNLTITDVPMPIADAIGQAGGTTTNADLSAVTVARGDKTYTVDLERLFYEGDLSLNMVLRHGDVVTVPDRRQRKIFVLGEVMQPKSYLLQRGRTSLAEALSDAGGPNPLSAHAGQVYVLRAGADEKPVIYQLDARSPEALILADRFALRPRDVVYIDPTQLARAGRVLAQLLPWLQGARTSQQLAE